MINLNSKSLMKRNLISIFLALTLCLIPVSFSESASAQSREPVRAANGMVASNDRIASEIGVEILRRGGTAVDAAIAVAFALAVTYPEAGNLGGGGFMMVRFRDGRTAAIDYREMAPGRATRNMFVDERGELIRGANSSTVGFRASGVPGTVAGMDLALRRYGSGRMTWSQLIEPARRLAADGFTVSYPLANSLRAYRERLNTTAEGRRIFTRNGNFYSAGERLRQPELAQTLARIQRFGAREFYTGRTAQLIAADMSRNNGLIALEDLRNYEARERTPVRGTYRGHEIISMPPPSSGGTMLIEMLNILEGYDLRRMGWSSAERYHVLTEAMRRAFADRAEYMGDPDFSQIPVAQLIDKDYAARLRRTINMNRASSSQTIRAGEFNAGGERGETTHFSIVDREGNAVSNTYTINDLYGSGVVITGTGIVMNDEMDDFAARPGTPNLFGLIQGERNAIEPRKRPLSSMTPTFVLRPDGSFWFTVGARGGPRIINAVLQTIINVVDHDMNIQQALDAPRIHHQWLPDELIVEPFGLSNDTLRILEQRGHRFSQRPQNVASCEAVMIEERNVRAGASDPRSSGAPVGY
jgi:gamma-glutamyltranspeptidase / glutathione hydrolase